MTWKPGVFISNMNLRQLKTYRRQYILQTVKLTIKMHRKFSIGNSITLDFFVNRFFERASVLQLLTMDPFWAHLTENFGTF